MKSDLSATGVLDIPPDLGDDSQRVRLLGFPLDVVTETECVDRILNAIDKGRGGWVVTHNLDHLRRLVRDSGFAALCASAQLRVADGMPLVWASRIQGTPLPERVAGSSLIWTLTESAAKRGRSIFLLGGEGSASTAAGEALRARYPGLKIAGIDPAPIGFDKNIEYMEQLKRMLRKSRPNIVYVALGSPKQELIISQLREIVPNAWWMGVGISFSFVCGDVRRAPRWVQRIGLEWVHRMAQEPTRLWRRYLWEGVPFALRLLSSAARRRLGRRLTA